jgi:hypothetical protein
MKYLLALVLGTCVFCVKAQTVCIPDSVADYFLESDDKRIILEGQIANKNHIIENLKQQLLLKNHIVRTYVNDSSTFRDIVGTKDKEIVFYTQQLRDAKKEIRRQKFLKITSWVALGAMTILYIKE